MLPMVHAHIHQLLNLRRRSDVRLRSSPFRPNVGDRSVSGRGGCMPDIRDLLTYRFTFVVSCFSSRNALPSDCPGGVLRLLLHLVLRRRQGVQGAHLMSTSRTPDRFTTSGLQMADVLSLPRGDHQGKDLPKDGSLRIGVKHRPETCERKTKRGDTLQMHYVGECA